MGVRDDFPVGVRRALGMRVAFRCSHPECGIATVGPGSDASDIVNVGVAAHIAAASPGGPRYDPGMSQADRISIENGIWLCQTHSREIDVDAGRHSAELLRRWKANAEAEARRLNGSIASVQSPGRAPIYVPELAATKRTRLSFASRSTPFLGRTDELRLLNAFISAPDPFLWMSVSGPAGSGKSRLLLEFLLAARPDWTGGFVNFQRAGFDWEDWHAADQSIIILDYATTYAEQTRSILAAAQSKAHSGNRIRIVLADRCDRATLERRLLNTNAMQALEPLSFDRAINLAPLNSSEVRELATAIAGPPSALHAEELDALPVESSFPLFAALVAQARAEGQFPAALDKLSIVRNWYDREKSQYWDPAGVTKSEMRLIGLVSIGGEWDAGDALSGRLDSCGIDTADVDVQRVAAVTGLTPLEIFHPLTPDILAEFFVLELLMSQNPANALSKGTLQAAWEKAPEHTAGFMIRAAQDFPEHPAILGVIGYVPADIPAGAELQRLGRPTLPTMWAEILPWISVTQLYRVHKLGALKLVRDACRTNYSHEGLEALKAFLGDQMFDDPISLQGQIIAHPRTKRGLDFEEARDLALRLSDLRWRMVHILRFLHDNLTGFADDALDCIVEATVSLFEAGKKDRRIRRDMSATLLGGITDRLHAQDWRRATTLWGHFADVFEWWLADPGNRAQNHRGFQEEPPSNDEWVRQSLLTLAEEMADDDDRTFQLHTSVFVLGENATDDWFVNQFGKATSNYITLLLSDDADQARFELALKALPKLAVACEALDGEHELSGRMIEVLTAIMKFHLRQGRGDEAERIQRDAEQLAVKFQEQGRMVSPGLGYLLAGKINTFARLNETDQALEVFDRLQQIVDLRGAMPENERYAVGGSIMNLATLVQARGATDRARQFVDILDLMDDGSGPTRILEARIAVRRNRLIWFALNGREDEIPAVLRELEPLAGLARQAVEFSYLIAAVNTALSTPPALNLKIGNLVAAIYARLFAQSELVNDPDLLVHLLQQAHGATSALRSADLAAATQIIDGAIAIAIARFGDPESVVATLRAALG